jgi:peptide deformylase
MAVKEILLLGNPKLYEVCRQIKKEELTEVNAIVEDLRDTLADFRQKHNIGRAIAAPQIGYMKRLIYLDIDEPVILINPIIDILSADMFEIWDDCMSFPDIMVKVKRHKKCHVAFKDINWENKSLSLEGSLSELVQHEVDHLNGILAVSRAVDSKALALKSQKQYLKIQ